MKKDNVIMKLTMIRLNVIGRICLFLFFALSSQPRMFLEVFIRKNFGRRYFTLASAITVAVLLIFFPFLVELLWWPLTSRVETSASDFWMHYGTWYAAIGYFCYQARNRWMESRKPRGFYDFTKVTSYEGDIDTRFYRIKLFGKMPDTYMVETLYEPALFFLIGIPLMMLGQYIGLLLMISALFYSFSYMFMYKKASDIILDHIDNMLCNRDMESTFVDGDESDPNSQDHAFRHRYEKPSSRELRVELLDQLIVKKASYYEDAA